MVKLGDRVQDRVTGFKGIVVARTEWLNGCVRLGLQHEKLKDGKPPETEWIDDAQVRVVKSGAVRPRAAIGSVYAPPSPVSRRGGPTPAPQRARDPLP